MSAEDLLRFLQRRPFDPFRIVLTDGTVYDVHHPEMVLLARRTAEIGLPQDQGQPIADRIVTISLLHIVRVEPLQATSATG
jgi:hypothetical protein